mmetsp:Transcript_20546/g.42440  ORF Transcript_20546/g.42440 Transcript_20546/m.42440 type:complete len:169 (+) Transcript_20546:86-592(+)
MTFRVSRLPLLTYLTLCTYTVQVSSFKPTSNRHLTIPSNRPHLLPLRAPTHHDTPNIKKIYNNLQPTTNTFSTSTTSLQMNFTPPSENDPTGLKEGFVLFGVVLLLNVWLFSVPPEYRRARFCSEEDVALYPDSKCTTFKAWRTGIMDYYANGGGVQFDFSIDPDSRK